MPISRVPTSDLSGLLWQMLNGDMSAVRPLLDHLAGEAGRTDDEKWLRGRIGKLAREHFGGMTNSNDPAVVARRFAEATADVSPFRAQSWEPFVNDVVERFWFDLFTLDSTVASLNDTLRRRNGVAVNAVELR